MPRRDRANEVRWWERHGPRLPARGIRAQTRHGAFGKTWWASRWITALERLVDPGRLTRGRSYARTGQVLSLQVDRDGVSAAVQGSRRTPYDASIQFTSLSVEAWERVFDALAAEALFAARLLSGEMPEQIEDVFAAAGSSLLPARGSDMQTSCSCPDWANPCKHVAAVYYLLGERFDEDPFLMFVLRGRSRDDVLEALRFRRSGGSVEELLPAEGEAAALAPDLRAFWSIAGDQPEIALKFALPEANALVVKRLGPAPFAADQRAFVEAMERTYRAVSEYALTLALGETPTVDDPEP